MTTTNENTKKLCLDLMTSNTEEEVIRLLTAAGYWDKPEAWRDLGDEEFNYSSVGNQQSKPEQAIIEKLINSIDAKLICEARKAKCLPLSGSYPQSEDTPKSVSEAREKFFGNRLNDLTALSHSIAVAATGNKPKEGNGRPCFTIVDDGEGQTPARMPETLLSLHKGNKDKIKFAQGKFNMGGTGVLEFCGMDRNLQLIISKRCPDLLASPPDNPNDGNWSFTVIRRDDPASEGKSSRFTYMAPVGADAKANEGELLHFAAPTLPIFPDKKEPYVRDAAWGTLLKLYEYDALRFASNSLFDDGLMGRVRLLLPKPALPIRFHECRDYKGHSGSFDTTMIGLVETLQNDLRDPKRDNVEYYDKLEFAVEGEKFNAEIYVFKNKDAAEAYKRNEGILYTYNGQCHAPETKDFFRRKKVKLDYLWHTLLMIVDCSDISPRAHEKLFMNSRDRLRNKEFKMKLESEIEDLLSHHERLKELASERRKKEMAESPKAAESMQKVLEKLLSKNPVLASLLGQGMRIKNPLKPESAGGGIAGFIGKRFPTKFQFKGKDASFKLIRDAHLASHARIAFETDAADDYFARDDEPGSFKLYRVTVKGLDEAGDYQRPRLYRGIANLSLTLPSDARDGDDIEFEAVVTDPSRVEPFKSRFILTVKQEREAVPDQERERGERKTKPDTPGLDGKGTGNDGSSQTRDGYLDVPTPTPVYEKDWKNKEPNFDKFTCMRIIRSPEAKEGEDKYDYFINMDNVHLLTYLKAKPKDAAGMRMRFSVGMTLVALAMLHQEQLRKKEGRGAADFPDESIDVADRVAQTTSALAPFLLPMIESVSELEGVEGEDEEPLSDSAGEAA